MRGLRRRGRHLGEIADALRRARIEQPVPSGESKPAGLRRASRPERALAERPAPSLARPEPPPDAEGEQQQRDDVLPADRAIVFADGPHAEICRQIALRMRERMEARRARSVAVVSAMRDEGKTTVACDLALALASLSTDGDVALVDLDLRKPSLDSVLALAAEHGVDEVLHGKARLEQACVSVQRPRLDIYPVITPQRTAHELLHGSRFEQLVKDLEARYETIIFDTPPTLVVPDATLILRHVSCCVPVARAGRTRVRRYRELIEALPKDRILGSILNSVTAGYGAEYYDSYYQDDPSEDPASPGAKRKRS